MSASRHNLYRLDDLLLRAGRLALLALLLAGCAFALLDQAVFEMDPDGLPGTGWIERHRLVLIVGGLLSIGLLALGAALRRREQRVGAVWSLLRQEGQIRVPELLTNSDFTRRDLDRTVRLLNNRGLDHYVWDRRADVIQDARLRTLQLYVDKCGECGAAISLSLPVAYHEVPCCPYCSEPISIETLEARRTEALERLRTGHAAPSDPSPEAAALRMRMSLPLFFFLMLFCWPAGMTYAFYCWRRAA